jgi:hypothetical protein
MKTQWAIKALLRLETYNTKKALEVAAVVMARRGIEFDTQEEAILNEVFEISKQWRRS